MKKIRTVCGDIAPEKVGYTLIHEHAAADLAGLFKCFGMDFNVMRESIPELKGYPLSKFDFTLENLQFLRHGGWQVSEKYLTSEGDDFIDFMVRELKAFKALGGNTICDLSYKGCSNRSVADLKRMSELSGVNIICCTGVACESAKTRPEKYAGKNEEELMKMFEDEVENGTDDTDIRPGLLKALMNNAQEVDHVRAIARISAETGLPMQIHCQRPMTIDDIVSVANMCTKELGADPGKVLINHTEQYLLEPMSLSEYIRTLKLDIKVDDISKILDTGINLSFDWFGQISVEPNELFDEYNVGDYVALHGLTKLLDQGYASQIMLGHDMCSKACALQNGGYGYTRVSSFVDPMLRKLGYEKEVEMMTVTNPMNYLAF